MSEVRALYPRLLRLGDRPTIVGHRCRACGRVAFPPDPYACERCGAVVDHLDEVELIAEGSIHAVATVHRHHKPEPPTPFTVATIVLDDQVTVKGMLVDSAGADVGARVRGVTVPAGEDEDGTLLVDLRFEVVGGGGD
ncbi:MAG: hypothetical protein GY929_17545 [Actinomycetia bacterium]|nr:hypothetical protein [Actinomycetes bacterium]